MPPATRSKNQPKPKKNDGNEPSTSKMAKNIKQSVNKSQTKAKKTIAGTVRKDEPDSEWKINYLEDGISSKCAMRRLESVQIYASRRGELRLFGLISDSLNEVERIIEKSKLAPKQTTMTEFYDAAERDGEDSETD